MSHDDLMAALAPVLDLLRTVDTGDADAAARLNRELPLTDPRISRLRALFAAGVAAGWLCDREGGGARFSRVAKPGPETADFSVDAVRMSGPGVWHRHTSGEIDLCFANTPGATFDGHGEGWVVFPPGSDHVPTVEGGEMDILYFLPGGAVEWRRS